MFWQSPLKAVQTQVRVTLLFLVQRIPYKSCRFITYWIPDKQSPGEHPILLKYITGTGTTWITVKAKYSQYVTRNRTKCINVILAFPFCSCEMWQVKHDQHILMSYWELTVNIIMFLVLCNLVLSTGPVSCHPCYSIVFLSVVVRKMSYNTDRRTRKKWFW